MHIFDGIFRNALFFHTMLVLGLIFEKIDTKGSMGDTGMQQISSSLYRNQFLYDGNFGI